MIRSIELALERFLRGEKATTEKLFDSLTPEEKAAACAAYFELDANQQETVVRFLTDEKVCRAICGFWCYLANRADENETVLLPDQLSDAIDNYNKTCSHVFGAVDQTQIFALFSIDCLPKALGFENPCLLLVNQKLPKLAFFGYLHGITGNDGPVADVLLDHYGFEFDKSFNEFRELDIPEQVIDALVAADKNHGRGKWLLTRILFACEKLNEKTLAKITDHLFSQNDISPMQVSLISASSDKMNTQRIWAYVEPLYRKSILAGDPKFFYLYAALKIAQCGDFMSTNAIKTICVSEDTCEIALALGEVSLNAVAVLYNAGTMMGFHSGVTVTAELSDRLLEFLSGEDDSLYYAAHNCLRDLAAIRQFDNGLLRDSKVVHKAIENLRSPVGIIKRAAEIVLGLMPFTSVRLLPSSLARRFFSYYKRAMRCEEYDWRLVLYFRALVCCGAWRQPGQLVQRYKQMYEYYVQHTGEMSREEEMLLQLTREELPKVDQTLINNSETDLDVLKRSVEMPSIFDICNLSCKADALALTPKERIALTAQEAQSVVTIALRQWLGVETKHFNTEQIKRLLSQSDLPDNTGSAIIVQWFQQLCNYDCPSAVAFYEENRHLLNRPCFFPEDERKCTFTKFAEFLELPSRVEMAMAEAIVVSKNGTVAQLFASQPYAPASLPESTREKIAAMLEKRKKRELPVEEDILTQWLDLGPNLMSVPGKAWSRFYDDAGVAQIAVQDVSLHEQDALFEAVLELGYGAHETVAAAALRKDPLWSLNYVAASLQSSEVILQALRDGIKNMTAEDD